MTILSTGGLIAESALGSFPVDDLIVYPDTFQSIGIIVDLGAGVDSTHEGTIASRYRKTGDGWSLGSDLIRISDYTPEFPGGTPTGGPFNRFAGSLMYLTPEQEYEIELTYYDPNNSPTTSIHTFQITTRAVPVKPTGGTTYYVDPDVASGGDGSSGDPFDTLEAADAVVIPGDIVKCRDGAWPQTLTTLNNGGSAGGGHVLYEPDTGHSPVMYRTKLTDNYFWFDNLLFTGQDGVTNIDGSVTTTTALYATGNEAGDVVVTGCDFTLFTRGVYLVGTQRITFMDNTGVGPGLLGIGSGSFLIRTGGEGSPNSPGSVIAYNKATSYSDNFNLGADSDLYGNDSITPGDDNWSCDDEESNVRIWGNRGYEAVNYDILPFQPQGCGPWYFMYNQIIDDSGTLFKWIWSDRCVLIGNTMIGNCGASRGGQFRFFMRNNLWFRNSTIQLWSASFGVDDSNRGSQLEASWNTDLDHDGFYTEGNIIRWDGVNYANISDFSAAVSIPGNTVYGNGVDVTPAVFVSYTPFSDTTILELVGGDNAAFEKGEVVPNLADFHGGIPDLGWIQRGDSPPQIGPRTSEFGLPLNQRTLDWIKH